MPGGAALADLGLLFGRSLDDGRAAEARGEDGPDIPAGDDLGSRGSGSGRGSGEGSSKGNGLCGLLDGCLLLLLGRGLLLLLLRSARRGCNGMSEGRDSSGG